MSCRMIQGEQWAGCRGLRELSSKGRCALKSNALISANNQSRWKLSLEDAKREAMTQVHWDGLHRKNQKGRNTEG